MSMTLSVADTYEDEDSKSIWLLFSPHSTDSAGALAHFLGIFSAHGVTLNRIESRSSTRRPGYEFMVECEYGTGDFGAALEQLKPDVGYLNIISKNYKDNRSAVPWFPRRIRDLDRFARQVMLHGAELEPDHPGFNDQTYRARRKFFADIAYHYRHGQPLPHVEYTAEEVATWGAIFEKLTEMYPTHACREHNHVFQLLIDNCGYRKDNIPQLEEVSNFLKDCTGFTLRPVSGLLSSRDFLAGLAFRVFHSTQYVRHHSQPFFTPEPDVCHELLGHAPLFADPSFAQFSQQIGLASLGAPDEYIDKLATCFWFTLEIGLCRQDGKLKAFGAALLSSFGELQYALSGKPELRDFDPDVTGVQKYSIDEYQPVYFVASSFEDAKEKMIKFASRIPRGFSVHYNPYTQSVDLVDSPRQVQDLLRAVHQDVDMLVNTMVSMERL